MSPQDYPTFEASNNTGNSKKKEKPEPYPTYSITLSWYPRMEKAGPKKHGRYAWAEESLLTGGTSPLIISNNDDLVSMSDLFARGRPCPHGSDCYCHPHRGFP